MPKGKRRVTFVRGASCPASFKKMVWHDGYDAGMGLPPKHHAGAKRPGACSASFVKKVWHDGYDAGEAALRGEVPENTHVFSFDGSGKATLEKKEVAAENVLADAVMVASVNKAYDEAAAEEKANLAKLSGLSRETLNFAENVALKAGLAPDLVSTLKKLGIEIGLAFT